MEHMGWKKSGFHGMFHIFDEKKNMEDAMISIFLHVLFFPSRKNLFWLFNLIMVLMEKKHEICSIFLSCCPVFNSEHM